MVDEACERIQHDTQMMLPLPGKSTSRYAHYQALAKKDIPEDWTALRAEIEEALRPRHVAGCISPAIESFYSIRSTLEYEEKITYETLAAFEKAAKIELESWEVETILEFDRVFHKTIGEWNGGANSIQHSH